jgi:2-C-methyl-D-erythritol 4-phosphate cytidylyltransferase
MAVPIAAIITAAGSSTRICGRLGGLKKEYRPSGLFDDEGNPLTVLGAAASAFAAVSRISLIVITLPADTVTGNAPQAVAAAIDIPFTREARSSLPAGLLESGRLFFVPGGESRRASVFNALMFLETHKPGYVLIHDGARPWVDADLIERTIDAAVNYQAVVPLLPLTETPKELDDSGFVKRHLRRAQIGAAQTPQGFAYPGILAAHEAAARRVAAFREAGEVPDYTDDAEIWGEFQGNVAVIPGSPANRKITFPEDLPEIPPKARP